MSEECPHGLTPDTCSICKHGPTTREDDHVSLCSSCEAEIIWVETEKGKRMPLNAEPDPVHGRFRKERLDLRDGKKHKIVHFVKNSELESNTRPLYTSHFATCEFADLHRKS